ncbi:hypothetical protein EMIT043CA1_320008 [Pseudomonas brassicacearum]
MSCTRKLRKGSSTGLLEVTRMKLRSPRNTGVKRRLLRKNARSTPARLKSSGLARLADRSPSLIPATSTRAISARNGWFRAEWSVMSPSPSADAKAEYPRAPTTTDTLTQLRNVDCKLSSMGIPFDYQTERKRIQYDHLVLVIVR